MIGAGSEAAPVAEVLRHLWLACSTYRLYPGAPDQPAFVAGVERVRGAVQAARAVDVLADAELRAEVVGGAFRVAGTSLAGDEVLDAFAKRCFDRGVEHIVVTGLPSAQDVMAVSDALLAPPKESEDLSARELPVADVLQRRGVRSIVMASVMLAGVDAPVSSGLSGPYVDPRNDPELDELGSDIRELWRLALDPGTMVANQFVTGIDDHTLSAQELYQTYRTVRSMVSDDLASRGDLVSAASEVLAQLPKGVLHQFLALSLNSASHDQFAEEFLGGLADTALADHLVGWMQAGGPDAVDVAARIVEATGRRRELVALTAARLADETLDPADGPTLQSLNAPDDPDLVRPDMADALGRRFLDSRSADVEALSAAIPADAAEQYPHDVAALRDYLRVDTSVTRIEQVVERWRLILQGLLRAGRAQALQGMMGLLQAAIADRPDGPATDVLRRANEGVVTAEVLHEILDQAKAANATDRLGALFQPLADQAIHGMVEALLVADDQAERAGLVTSLSALAPGRVAVVAAAMTDQPWYVVRNLVTVLGRSGDRDAVPPLVRATKDAQPQVRREAARVLVSVLGGEAVPHVLPLVADLDEGVRRAAIGMLAGMSAPRALQGLAQAVTTHPDGPEVGTIIEALAASPAPAAAEVLRSLDDKGVRKSLPRGVRKTLAAALKDRE